MLRTVMSIAFLSAFLAVTPIAFSAEADAEKCEKSAQCEKGQCEKGQCEKGPCAASACTGEKCASFTATSDGCANKTCSGGVCEGNTCQSTTARLIQVTTTLDSGSEAVCSGNKQCCAGDDLSAVKPAAAATKLAALLTIWPATMIHATAALAVLRSWLQQRRPRLSANAAMAVVVAPTPSKSTATRSLLFTGSLWKKVRRVPCWLPN